MKHALRSLCAVMLLLAGNTFAVDPPSSKTVADILANLKQLARHGDWLVIRGLHNTDDLVSTVTNMPLSHAGLLDLERGIVIEAEGIGVHETALPEFAAKSARLLLIRPQGWTPERGNEAVRRGRAMVGKKYDYSGLLGVGLSDRYYCTELTVSVYRDQGIELTGFVPPVIAPGQMYHWGTILYDSGPAP